MIKITLWDRIVERLFFFETNFWFLLMPFNETQTEVTINDYSGLLFTSTLWTYNL